MVIPLQKSPKLILGAGGWEVGSTHLEICPKPNCMESQLKHDMCFYIQKYKNLKSVIWISPPMFEYTLYSVLSHIGNKMTPILGMWFPICRCPTDWWVLVKEMLKFKLVIKQSIKNYRCACIKIVAIWTDFTCKIKELI